MKDIPIVEQLPLMITCDNSKDTGHSVVVEKCPACEEEVVNKLNFELQVEADKSKRI